MPTPLRLRSSLSAAAALLALSAGAASAQQYYAAPPAQTLSAQPSAAQTYAAPYAAQPQNAFQSAPAPQAVQSAAPNLASVYAGYAQPAAAAYAQPATTYAQPATTYAQPATTYAQPATTYAQPSATTYSSPIYNPQPTPQPQAAAPYAYPQIQPQATAQVQGWSAPAALPPPAPIGAYVPPAQPAQASAYPGYSYGGAYAPPPAPVQPAYVQPAPIQPAGPSLAGWERGFASNIEAVNACLKATALTDVSVTGVITESVTRETHVILNGRFSANTPPRREFCAWSAARREARMLDATGRPQFDSEGAPSYAPVGARFSFANLAALQPVVDTDYRLLGWMRWEKAGVQPASDAPPAADILKPLRIEGYRWS